MEYLVWQIRLLLIIGSLCAFAFAIKYIRNSRVKIEDTIFWMFMCLLMLIMSIFPQIPYWFARVLNVESTANFVFLLLIALLIINQFFLAIRLSQLEIRLHELAQSTAIKDKIETDKRIPENGKHSDNT